MENANKNVRSRIRGLGDWVIHPPLAGPAATVLLRCMAGGVFLSEGILKFLYPGLGVVRFTKLGFPLPLATASLVGGLEIVGGLLLIAGLFTRLVAIPFIAEMVVAILSTKISLYLGTSPLAPPPAPPRTGFWAVMHESRSEYAQLLTVAFLLLTGPGRWSLDGLLRRGAAAARRPSTAPAAEAALTDELAPTGRTVDGSMALQRATR
jgi:putative oxidoreductase